MRRLQLGLVAFAVPMLALSLVLVGCGKPNEEGGSTAPTGTGDKGTKKGTSSAKAELQPVKGEYKGTLKGKITLKGNAQPIIAKLDEAIKVDMSKNQDKDYCMMGRPEETNQQEYKVGENNGVGNVFVWIEPAEANHYFTVDETLSSEAKKPVVMDQPHCAFLPHCVGIFAEYQDPKSKTKKTTQTGAELHIKNSADKSHNTNSDGGPVNGKKNEILGKGKEMVLGGLKPSKEPIRIRCNIHGWMSAYAWPFSHPYFAVSLDHDPGKDIKDKDYFLKKSDARYGTYEIKNVPQGAKVRVIAWHEKAGYLAGATGKEVDLAAGKDVDFELEAK